MLIKRLKVHFIGIGGIGVSALARYYLEKGHIVSGSDLVRSEITDALGKAGVKLTKNIPANCDLVIYSPAVKIENYKLKIPALSYPEALGQLTKQYYTIAVCGTQGKSTTTAMIGLLLTKAGLDPTVIIGAKVKEFKDSNCRVGKSKYLVIEADEHFASFLNYWPKMIVITNVERDHLDYYKNYGNILKAFNKFISHLPKDGVLCDLRNRTILCDFVNPTIDIPRIKKVLKVPGEHNVENALAALAVARALKIPDKVSFKALSEYQGIWRRFEIIQTKPFILISDYGHNPTKALAALKAAREKYPTKKIWCVFQPHQYQRTYYLFKDFVKIFRQAPVDRIIITDIYDVAGREEKAIRKNVDSQKLVRAIAKKNIIYLPNDKIVDYLKKNLASHQVLIIMGAGDIYKMVDIIKKIIPILRNRIEDPRFA